MFTLSLQLYLLPDTIFPRILDFSEMLLHLGWCSIIWNFKSNIQGASSVSFGHTQCKRYQFLEKVQFYSKKATRRARQQTDLFWKRTFNSKGLLSAECCHQPKMTFFSGQEDNFLLTIFTVFLQKYIQIQNSVPRYKIKHYLDNLDRIKSNLDIAIRTH